MPPETKIPNSSEIDKALKEFELSRKSNPGQTQNIPEAPKVVETPSNSEIDQAVQEFQIKSTLEKTEEVQEVSKASELPKMVQFVIKYSGGAIKEQKQAEYVLLGLVVLMLAVSFYLFFGGGNKQQKLTPAQLEQQMRMMPPPPVK